MPPELLSPGPKNIKKGTWWGLRSGSYDVMQSAAVHPFPLEFSQYVL